MKHFVKVPEPHPTSQAAAVMLRRVLRTQEIRVWMGFRDRFLALQKAKDGVLRCHYCGKAPLVEEVPMRASKAQLRLLATLDHVVPKSKGGKVFDEANLVVACFPCNQRKGDGTLLGR
jgi:5-methylcytosine-specific restriction endonuclease McrA